MQYDELSVPSLFSWECARTRTPPTQMLDADPVRWTTLPSGVEAWLLRATTFWTVP